MRRLPTPQPPVPPTARGWGGIGLWALWLALVLLAPWARSAPAALVLDNSARSAPVWSALTMLPDPEQRFSAEGLLQDASAFQPVPTTEGTLGVRPEPVWLRLPLAVARRLQSQVRQSELVARHIAGTGQAHELGNKLLESFREPFPLGGAQVRLGLTIGYALAPLDSRDAVDLLKRADAAMYAGKQGGKFRLQRSPGAPAAP